jgi:ribosomal protein S6--L-glutamate ligase
MKIAILSRNSELYSTKRLVETAEKRGYSPQVINHLKCNIEIDPSGPKLFYNGYYLEGFDAVIPRIGASVTYYGTAVVRQFEMMHVFSVANSRSIVHSRDRLRCLQLLSKAKIGQPKTVFTNYSKNVEHVVESVGGTPVVMKLLRESDDISSILAEDKSSADSVLEAFNGVKARVIVQEYIKEAKGTDVRMMVVDGQVVGAIKRFNKDRDFHTNTSRRKKSIPIVLTEEEKEIAVRAAFALKLGVAGVDIIQSKRGPLVLNVNSSPGLKEIESVTKEDIAGKIIDYIEKNVALKQ